MSTKPKRKIEPRNRKLARLELRYINDTEETKAEFGVAGGGPWVLTCGGAAIDSYPLFDVKTVRKIAREEQRAQWEWYRIATELRFWNKNGKPMKGPGSVSTFPRSRDPRRSRG